MSKILLSFILTVVFQLSVSAGSKPANEQKRQEMQSLRMEKEKLHTKERLLRLKHLLNLQENQMDAWSAYEAHVEESAGNKMQMVNDLRNRRTAGLPTGVELAEANVARLERQLTEAKGRLSAFSEFYSVLNNDQRAAVDKLAHKKVRKAARKARGKMKQPKEPGEEN